MEQNIDSALTRLNRWIKESVTLKLMSIGILILLLLIPTSMITNLILERQQTSESVVREVSADWGFKQTIKGPALVIPYIAHTSKGDETRYALFLPDKLAIKGNIDPEERKRSIYKVIVYSSKMEITGHFSNISFSDWNISKEDILYNDAYIISGISDLRGIKDNIVLEWNNTQHEFNAGVDNVALINSGIKARVPVGEETYKFKYDLKLNGSQSIHFIPVGKETVVEVQSSWKDPAFVGGFLPESHQIGDNGFSSRWKVLHFNRNYPQRWLSTEPYDLDESSAFGVNLLLPVDHYQKNYRSAKYAVLLISLTFLIFFFIEVLNKKRIHPFQYILVGIALCVFYTLLLSFSEQLGFGISYLISAVAIIGLITIYLIGVLKSYKSSAIAASFLSLLYLFIFIILQLQDFALLAGSIGLFAALAVVMILSRNINWYEPGAEMVKEKA